MTEREQKGWEKHKADLEKRLNDASPHDKDVDILRAKIASCDMMIESGIKMRTVNA